MALHTTKLYKLPVIDICGFCRTSKTVYAEVHLNIDQEQFPNGVSIDMCKECFDAYESELDNFVIMAV